MLVHPYYMNLSILEDGLFDKVKYHPLYLTWYCFQIWITHNLDYLWSLNWRFSKLTLKLEHNNKTKQRNALESSNKNTPEFRWWLLEISYASWGANNRGRKDPYRQIQKQHCLYFLDSFSIGYIQSGCNEISCHILKYKWFCPPKWINSLKSGIRIAGEGCDAQKASYFCNIQVNGTVQSTEFRAKNPQTLPFYTSSTFGLGQYQLSLEKIQLLQKMVLQFVVLFQGLCKKREYWSSLFLLPFQKKKHYVDLNFPSPSCFNMRKNIISLMIILLPGSIIYVVKGNWSTVLGPYIYF